MKKLALALITIATTAAVFATNVGSAGATSIARAKLDTAIKDRFPALLGIEHTGDASAIYDPDCLKVAGFNMVRPDAYLASVETFTDSSTPARAIAVLFKYSNTNEKYFSAL
jgi:hypothetical protein